MMLVDVLVSGLPWARLCRRRWVLAALPRSSAQL